MKRFYILMLLTCVLCACKTQVPLPVVMPEYHNRTERDTVTVTDTVYKSRYVREKGDTVYITDTLFRYKYRDRIQEVCVHDSVPYEVKVQVPVRTRNGYDRFTSWGFWIFVILLLLRLAWWFVKKYYLRV